MPGFPLYIWPEDERADDNPRDCVVFRIYGYHTYARDNRCSDCAKPNPRRTDNGR